MNKARMSVLSGHQWRNFGFAYPLVGLLYTTVLLSSTLLWTTHPPLVLASGEFVQLVSANC